LSSPCAILQGLRGRERGKRYKKEGGGGKVREKRIEGKLSKKGMKEEGREG